MLLCSRHTSLNALERRATCNLWLGVQSSGARGSFGFKSELCQPLSSIRPLGKLNLSILSFLICKMGVNTSRLL